MPPKHAGAKGGSRIKKEGQPDVYRIGGQDVPYDPELEYEKPKPTPLYPVRTPSFFLSGELTNQPPALQNHPPKAPHRNRENPDRPLQSPPRKHTQRTFIHDPRRKRARHKARGKTQQACRVFQCFRGNAQVQSEVYEKATDDT